LLELKSSQGQMRLAGRSLAAGPRLFWTDLAASQQNCFVNHYVALPLVID